MKIGLDVRNQQREQRSDEYEAGEPLKKSYFQRIQLPLVKSDIAFALFWPKKENPGEVVIRQGSVQAQYPQGAARKEKYLSSW